MMVLFRGMWNLLRLAMARREVLDVPPKHC